MAKLKAQLEITADELAEAITISEYPELAAACEEYYSRQLDDLVEEIVAHRKIRAVFISGPTNSGKTTTTDRLKTELSKAGREARMISLDDYYVEGAVRYDEDGRPDYESVDTISLELLSEDLRLLMEGKAAWVPHFNFKERKRIYEREQKLKLKDNELVLVEGLHALSPVIKDQLDPEISFGIFLMPNVELETRNGILGSETTRKLRRIHRDNSSRDTRALETIDFWPMVRSAEQIFIPRYIEAADVHINTALPYEYAILGPRVRELLAEDLAAYEARSLRPSPNVREGLFYANLEAAVEEARQLYDILGGLPSGDVRVVPNDSVLKEFI
ncbi:MAG: nucleoside kinase [Eubacteriales bacterium]|nr:nucleoside kinase [Eubacteriales bacterium]